MPASTAPATAPPAAGCRGSRAAGRTGVPASRPSAARCRSRCAACTSPARWRRCPGSSRSTRRSRKSGLNTIQLDVKDEGGEIGFRPAGVPLAAKVGAVRALLRARARSPRMLHAKGIYLIGRVVVFQDPVLAACATRPRDPPLRRRRSGRPAPGSAGSTPTTGASGTTPSAIAAAAARAGFDEIMLDYVRFPSDGDAAPPVYPGRTTVPTGRADRRLRRLRAAAARAARRPDLDGAVRALRDARPAHRPGAGVDLAARRPRQPDGVPRALRRRRARHHDARAPSPARRSSGRSSTSSTQLKGSRAQLIPWIQDWNYDAEAGAAADRGDPAAGREGLPALERVRALHEERARASQHPVGAVPVGPRARSRTRPAAEPRPAPTARAGASPAAPSRS